MTLIIFDPVSPRLEALAERAKTSTEADARAARKMGEVIQLRQPARPTEDQRAERKANASYHRGYWHGYTHAVRETSLIDGMVVAVTFLAGFGFALILVGALS